MKAKSKIDIEHLNGNGNDGRRVVIRETAEERHTEEVHEIITKVPSWIVRWGILLFFGILLFILSITAVIRYPDTIKTPVRLQTTAAAYPVMVSAGVIQTVSIKPGAAVKRGQLLATILNNDNEALNVSAPVDGVVSSPAILQPGSIIPPNTPLFTIHPVNEHFYGDLRLPTAGINKIKIGQRVLISLKNFPPEEYGQLDGHISYITDEPDKNGMFSAKVTLNSSALKKQVVLRSWMTGDAEIITQDVSLATRLLRNIKIK